MAGETSGRGSASGLPSLLPEGHGGRCFPRAPERVCLPPRREALQGTENRSGTARAAWGWTPGSRCPERAHARPSPPPRQRGRGRRACRGRARHLRLWATWASFGRIAVCAPCHLLSGCHCLCTTDLAVNERERLVTAGSWASAFDLSFLSVKVPLAFNVNVVRITRLSLYSLYFPCLA